MVISTGITYLVHKMVRRAYAALTPRGSQFIFGGGDADADCDTWLPSSWLECDS